MRRRERALTDKTMVISGASTGIGEACARYLEKKGFQVFAGVRTQPDGDRLAKAGQGRVVPLILDVTDPESIRRSAEIVREKLGNRGLLGLVNNAGIVVGGPLELVPINRLRMQLEVNLVGQVAVTQAFLPLLRKARGRIVNMSSISGRVASPMVGPYAISKFGLEAFSDSLRRELRSWGIHVSVVEPGAISTPIWSKTINRANDVLEELPDKARELYGESIDAARQDAAEMSDRAIPSVEVAKVVYHALTASRPRTRYLVGKDAKVAARLAWLLPDRVMDWLIRKSKGR